MKAASEFRSRRPVRAHLSRDAGRPGGDDPVVPRFSQRPALPDFADRFIRCLYATYLSYLPEGEFAYALDIKRDNRGELAEFLKSPHCGQIFVSRTKPGVTRGNHFHHTKIEKFLVVEGEALIRFRHIEGDEVLDISAFRRGLPGGGHPAGLHALDQERGHRRDGRVVLGQRDLRSRRPRHVCRRRCCMD